MVNLEEGKLIAGRYRVIREIASGGSSTVYQVQQLGLNVDRALKVLGPQTGDTQLELFEKTFQAEIRLLSLLSHRNLTKILDYGQEPINGKNIKYFVMEYANSGNFDRLFEQLNTKDTLNDFLRHTGEVLDALHYLHHRNIMHGDIKGANILIHTDEFAKTSEAKLADLGVAKPLGQYSQDPSDLFPTLAEETYFFGTRRYAPPYAHDVLNQKAIVHRTKLQGYFPHFDLFCLGATLLEGLSKNKLRSSGVNADEINRLLDAPKDVFRYLPEGEWNYLCNFIRLLLNNDPAKGLKTEEARDAFMRMNPRKLVTALVPEITNIGSNHVIPNGDGLIRFSERAYKLVEHPVFQRLQRLNQLNFVEAIYPDARQTRLSHCLEAFELARNVVCHLLGNGTFRLHVNTREVGLFLASALLHDIGHYPLAHMVEDLRNEIDDADRQPTADFELAEYFLEYSHNGSLPIAKILQDEWKVSVPELMRVISKARRPETIAESFFKQLLDGAIDIDKLAYLTKDSTFTGAAYGRGIDIQALISSLTIIPQTPNSSPVVGLEHKGISPAESLISARYHMFSRVYWHHANRALMAMVRYALSKVMKNSLQGYSFQNYISDTLHLSDIEALRLVSKKYDELSSKLPDLPPNPVHGILDSSRTIYKRLVSFSKHPENHSLRLCQEYLGTSHWSVIEKLRKRALEELSRLLHRQIADSHLLFDVPRMVKERDINTSLYVSDPSATIGIIQLNAISKVIGAIHDDFQSLTKKSRIFIHPMLREELRKTNKEELAKQTVENIIIAAASANS